VSVGFFTLTLSLRERGQIKRKLNTDSLFSLSLRERAGVRGN